MFARWHNVRIKAAEKALRQGRLDDALEAVRQPDVRDTPRGQQLADALVEPLIARARVHRQAGRYRDALGDLDQLAALGRETPEVQTLRQRIRAERDAAGQQQAEERRDAERAADQLRAGRLDTARVQLDRVDDPHKRKELAEELDVRVQRGAALLDQAREALHRNDVLTAIRLWQDTTRRHGRTADTDRFAAQAADACRTALENWHRAGEVARLLAARPAADALAAHDPTLADCQRLTELVDRAVAQLTANNYASLRQTLLRLKAVHADVAWVNGALDALARIAECQEMLLASPLGLYASDAGTGREKTSRPPALDQTFTSVSFVDNPPAGGPGVSLAQALLMLVDGGGSSLVLRRDLVRIGRAGTRTEIDVPIPADIDSHHADIIRRGDEYLLTAYGPVRVNHQPVDQALLRDNDRIALGDVRLTFHKPTSKSASAVLRLSHRCRLAQDVSAIVLFRDTCLIGPGATCHVRTREDDGQVVLFERDGELYARQTAGSGYLSAPVQPVVKGETLDLGNLRVTLKPFEASRA